MHQLKKKENKSKVNRNPLKSPETFQKNIDDYFSKLKDKDAHGMVKAPSIEGFCTFIRVPLSALWDTHRNPEYHYVYDLLKNRISEWWIHRVATGGAGTPYSMAEKMIRALGGGMYDERQRVELESRNLNLSVGLELNKEDLELFRKEAAAVISAGKVELIDAEKE